MVPLPLFIIHVAGTASIYAYFRVAIAFQSTSVHCSSAGSITGHARLYSNFFLQSSCLSETPGRFRIRLTSTAWAPLTKHTRHREPKKERDSWFDGSGVLQLCSHNGDRHSCPDVRFHRLANFDASRFELSLFLSGSRWISRLDIHWWLQVFGMALQVEIVALLTPQFMIYFMVIEVRRYLFALKRRDRSQDAGDV